MSTYETDEEKVEAIKKWWKDNGVSVIAGIAIGLGAVFGWRAWVNYQEGVRQEASAAFEQLMAAAEVEPAEAALARAQAIVTNYGSTPYAALAQLMAARIASGAGDKQTAREALESVIAKAPDPGIASIAALRLARLLLSTGELDAARALISRHEGGGGFAGDFAAVRGDIAVAAGDHAEARRAYEQALATGTANPSLVQLKLDNLPPAG